MAARGACATAGAAGRWFPQPRFAAIWLCSSGPFLAGPERNWLRRGPEYRGRATLCRGKYEAFPSLAAELVRLDPDIIVTVGTPAHWRQGRDPDDSDRLSARVADPIGSGLVGSFARPGGNLTALSVQTRELAAKRLEFLTTAVPDAKRVGVLWDLSFPPAMDEFREIGGAARSLNLGLVPADVRRPEDFKPALRTIVDNEAGALIVLPAIIFLEHAQQMLDLTAKAQLPAACYNVGQATAGP